MPGSVKQAQAGVNMRSNLPESKNKPVASSPSKVSQADPQDVKLLIGG